jgi:exoribonuclease II
VIAAAEQAVTRTPTEHVDRTDRDFVTLDPATSTDLDQAFAIDRSGNDLVLHYAIADVAWFVRDGDPLDSEAWRRGETLYLPDGRAGLYPPALSEDAASLLPTGPRPAVIFTVRVAPDGAVQLDGAERAVIRSRAKLAYDRVTDAELPPGSPISTPASRRRRAAGRIAHRPARARSIARRQRCLRAVVHAKTEVGGAECSVVAGDQHGRRRCAGHRRDRAVPRHACAG